MGEGGLLLQVYCPHKYCGVSYSLEQHYWIVLVDDEDVLFCEFYFIAVIIKLTQGQQRIYCSNGKRCTLRTAIGKCGILINAVCVDCIVEPSSCCTITPVLVGVACTHGVLVQK